ncbi:MAG: NAD-dependent epimerase/dehydratase family protein, partial [Granulosicoccaceae bacterium]
AIYTLFKTEKFDKVCHLAAQAGVRYSLENPHAYINSNITGFLNILEASRLNEVEHLTYASSSSVYGKNTQVPYSTTDNVDNPVSLYAATKKANELMAHTYSHLYNLPTTGLRFFTVYGPWGRPDMAIYKFTKRIMNDDAIDVYNYGNMSRDFTYIDDIVEGVVRILEKPTSEQQKYKVYNIGNNAPVQLLDFIKAIENSIGKEAKKNMMPLQMGDVLTTWADTNDLINDFDYKPNTSIEFGIKQFI